MRDSFHCWKVNIIRATENFRADIVWRDKIQVFIELCSDCCIFRTRQEIYMWSLYSCFLSKYRFFPKITIQLPRMSKFTSHHRQSYHDHPPLCCLSYHFHPPPHATLSSPLSTSTCQALCILDLKSSRVILNSHIFQQIPTYISQAHYMSLWIRAQRLQLHLAPSLCLV